MFTIIPAKPFNQAKTRLASILSTGQRVILSQRLLRRTIELARHVSEVVVISRDSHVRRTAKQAGAWALVEGGNDLNAAVRQASQWVAGRHHGAILVLPADLPLLTLADLTELIDLSQPAPSLVIAPCRRTSGTNALLIDPPDLIDFQFGPDSFARHLQAAQQKNVEAVIYRSPTTAFDLDLPEDFKALENRAP
ncbi:MAG: 2-phospho-L-lactate guanylyltransferase [Anaerolineaceae bacterium]|nr:2-phospho-L-lactate guanylyltransferase [Anaerolineaceae bacterium]MCB9098675.1 2-phospho-L-lactate guanylyltransferase [Anaerolineales bacterium]